jgi:hypothetical protein
MYQYLTYFSATKTFTDNYSPNCRQGRGTYFFASRKYFIDKQKLLWGCHIMLGVYMYELRALNDIC